MKKKHEKKQEKKPDALRQIDWQGVFGDMPESVDQKVRQALKTEAKKEERAAYTPRKLRAAVLLTALALVLTGTVALAVSRWGVMDFFSFKDQHNEKAAQGVQEVLADSEGKTVRMTVDEALYDREGGSYALKWTMENKTGEENLYLYCDGVYFGGERAWIGASTNAGDTLLAKDQMEGGAAGQLPEGSTGQGEIRFSILRLLAPLERIEPVLEPEQQETAQQYWEKVNAIWERGHIPTDGFGTLMTPWGEEPAFAKKAEEKPDDAYKAQLLSCGRIELAEEIAVQFTLAEEKLDGTRRIYQGQQNFIFDGYELRIQKAEIGATGASFVVEYITEKPPRDDGKGMGPGWNLRFENAAFPAGSGDSGWYHQGGGFIGRETSPGQWNREPEQLADGRFRSVYNWEVSGIFTQPDEIRIVLETYEPDGENAFRTIRHEDDAVILSF